MADCTLCLGITALKLNNTVLAKKFFTECQGFYEQLRSVLGVASVLRWLGRVDWKLGEWELAEAFYKNSLDVYCQLFHKYKYHTTVIHCALTVVHSLGIAEVLEGFGYLWSDSGDVVTKQKAVMALGHATAIRDQINVPMAAMDLSDNQVT